MSNIQKTAKQELMSPETETDKVLKTLLPLAETYLRQQVTESEERTKQHSLQMEVAKVQTEKHFELQTKSLDFARHRFNVFSFVLIVVLVFTLGLSAWLIAINQTEKGLLVISHAFALASGVLIGRSAKNKANEKAD